MNGQALRLVLAAAALLFIAIGAYADCDIAHCWNILGSASVGVQGLTSDSCAASISGTPIDGRTYDYIILPGSRFEASGYSGYNVHCDDGAGKVGNLHYVGARFGNASTGWTGWVTNAGGVALDAGFTRCARDSDGCAYDSGRLGAGSNTTINYTFGNVVNGVVQGIGPTGYQLAWDADPIAGTGFANSLTSLSSASYYLAGYPSLLVFAQSDSNRGFYEQAGRYTKNVFFTLVNKFPLELKVNDYTMNCPGIGVSCWIDRNYFVRSGYFNIPARNGLTIVPATVTVDKNQLPVSFAVSLDVNYSIAAFESKAACAAYSRNITHSKPAVFNFGLLDRQDFQVEMKAAQDQNFCIGEDGMIGQTGEYFAPRVNVGFGGAADSDGLVSIDECDPKRVSADGSPADNNDWVFCNQKEFLVELAKKIMKIGKLRETSSGVTQEALYSAFGANIRRQGFAKEDVLAAIASIPTSVFSNMGLNATDYLGDYTTNPNTQITYLANLYNRVEFEGTEMFDASQAFDAGRYRFTIDINELAPPTDKYIFSSVTGQVNDNIAIKVKITPVQGNFFNWIFYDYGNLDIDEGSINTQTIASAGDFSTTNNLERGITLKLVYDRADGAADKNFLYRTFAVPIMARVSDRNGIVDRNFGISRVTTNPALFSYWTGFASTLGSGCQTIENSLETALPKREPDSRMSDAASSTFMFNLDFLNSTKKDQNMYIETVLFLPRNTQGAEGVTMYAPFNVYTKNMTCRGTSAAPCILDINSSLTSFMVRNNDSFASVLEGIRNGSMCVHKGINDDSKMQWTVFWNQQKILQDLSAQKGAIRDANICATRELLGG